MDRATQLSWRQLGWREKSWDEWEGEPAPETVALSWDDLNSREKRAATGLGYNEHTWDMDDTYEPPVAQLPPP